MTSITNFRDPGQRNYLLPCTYLYLLPFNKFYGKCRTVKSYN
jgi:hypothetical protein